jgi:predicted NBD/HSP70 family sugar kinase
MRVSDQEANRLNVLKAIRRAEPVARSELAKLTGLSGATITDIVAELAGRNLLLEEKAPRGGMGRRRVQLRLNPDAAYVVGAFMLPSGLTVEISNLRGDRLFGRSYSIDRPPTIEAGAERIADLLDETIAASPFEKSMIHSVGLSLPATIDSAGGLLHWLQTYPPRPVPVAAIIEKRIKLPVTVDNSANVVARAEHWFGEDRQLDDFSLFIIGLGMEFARYVDGFLWAGAHGLNPELAHMKAGFDGGPRCTCGARGCLTTYVTVSGIVARICELRGLALLESGPKTVQEFSHVNALFHEFAADARTGEHVAREAFELAGRVLGIAVANYINAWDPARVLVLVEEPLMAHLLTAPFYAALQENTLAALRGRAPVLCRVAADQRHSQGAAALVLERIYRVSDELKAMEKTRLGRR